MKRVGGWLNAKASTSASKSLNAIDEPVALEDALAGAAHIMNDDIDKAEEELSKGTSPFHKLGRATTAFLRAVLGFEKDVMEQAGLRLAECEEAALEHQKKAIRDPSTTHQSDIYSVGSEYALIHAETQLMSAVVAVLNESLTESLRGFYKLRKAFNTLHEIAQAEQRYIQKKGLTGSANASKTSLSATPSESSGVLTPNPPKSDDEDEDLEFVDADEDHVGEKPVEYQGHLDAFDMSKLDKATQEMNKPPAIPATGAAAAAADRDVDFREVTNDPIDIFIHSGTALCFGLLQLLLSMIPPAFSKLLSMFSFRGDRTNGLRLLWSATKFKKNINGAMAGLILLGFSNGAIAFCDILAHDALPKAKLRALLEEMRTIYPKSRLWLLEEARMLSGERELEQAIKVMDSGDKSPLRQVEALRTFERSLNLMYLHRYDECAKSFIKCVELNSWSHALYYYIAGASYIELYRLAKGPNPAKAKEYATKGEELLKTVPSHTGKKRFMARQLPFDIFVNRKITKWTARAEEHKISFADAVGVSPIEEMTYFWSGYKRMPDSQLELSLQRLAWSETQPSWAQEREDERAVHSVLKATCLRFLGRVPTAKSTISAEVFSHELANLKACPHPDVWPLPVGHYELAVCYWDEAGGENGNKAVLQKCSEELGRTERWESFELEARIGLKVTTARETLRKIGVS